ncbi:MAG: MFS transporter [Chloroflexota bacterium]
MTAQVFLNMLGLGIVGPVMPLYAKSFGVSAAMVGMLGTAFAVARIGVNLPVGTLADRIGRRPLLVAGPLITAFASLMSGLAQQFNTLLVFRFIQGIGSAALVTTAMTTLADITTRETRGRAMSIYQGALLLGQSFGPTVGGLVGEHFGFRAPFFAYALLSLLAGLWALVAIPETRAFADQQARSEAPTPSAECAPESAWDCARRLLRDKDFLLISMIMFMVFFTRSGSQSNVLPLFGSFGLGLTTAQVGLTLTVIAVANLVTLNWSGSLSDRLGRKAVIVPASIFTGLALVVFIFSRNYAFFVASAVLFGVSTGLAGPAPAAYVADLAQPGRTALTLGLSRSISDVGMAIGPVFLGWIVDHQGYGAALLTNAALYLVVGTAFGLLARETVARPLPRKAAATGPQ